MKLDTKDLEKLYSKGITEKQLEDQLRMLREGFPYLRLVGPAVIGNGISKLSPQMEMGAIACWDEFLAKGGTVVKMVPASGAASRMFKDVYSFVNGKNDSPNNDFIKEFFNRIEDFAFFNRLNFVTLSHHGLSIASMLKQKRYKEVAEAMLEKSGLNYGKLPKALLQFHKVTGTTRTPLEEHLAEGAKYAAGKDKKVHVHFTVSEEHMPLMQYKVEEASGHLGHEYDVEYDVTYSVQKANTDTIAVTKNNDPYRENGELFFRPGGHGALIENLNDLDADVIFIKNIDNVVPDTHRNATIQYKRVLGGTLVAVKQRLNEFCGILSNGEPTEDQLADMQNFLLTVLCTSVEGIEAMSRDEKINLLLGKFNRPLRVCGMVRNEGEPGGGPFLAYNPDGSVSPQILESTQINPKDKEAVKFMKESTHFNPVDLAVSIKDFKGDKFNLPDYVDKSTGFISSKSREGVEIKALELPGLWNGAMSDWNTIFIEVPAQTFNPVKTVNDLLRQAHQPLPTADLIAE
ncbi:MAG: DUF4301 family protein [Candidatus Amulumruptor caecigallinarius]|nr:DUF4301 family protein [Candidatus Amulumruptor caecigallinarius]